MKETIRKIARDSLLDEVRFIDAGALTGEFVGKPELFAGRQPRDLMATAKTVVLVSAYIGKYILPPTGEYGRVSRLVLSGFYSNIVRPLAPIAAYLRAQGHRVLVVDGAASEQSIPIKGAAVKAGLGWIGKNTLLVSERYGSFQALGALLTDAALAERYPVQADRCGSCSRCVSSCPTQAIQAPRMLKKPRCLSHQFGEEPCAVDFSRIDSQGYFFECDLCQNVCPWNRSHIREPLETPFGALFDSERTRAILCAGALQAMDERAYNSELAPLLGKTKLTYSLFRRNLQVALQGAAAQAQS